MSKTSVILPAGRGEFHRTIRKDGEPVLDKDGKPRVLTFQPGQPVELTPEELEAVRDDIGPALHIAKLDDEAKPVAKADGEATAKFVQATKDLRAKAAADKAAAAKKATKAPAAEHAAKDHETKGK